MPADSELWIPPLSPKDQEKLANAQTASREREKLVLLRRKQAKQRKIVIDRAGFWLNLVGVLAIPFIVTFLGLYATQQITQQQNQLGEKQHQTDLQIAKDQQEESALQTYLDRMSDLLLNNKLLQSQPGDEVRNVARSRTLTILPQLNGTRKGELIHFLQEADLIRAEDAIVSLMGADLSEANLNKADLTDTYLFDANLSGADLSGARLMDADLGEANLSVANLNRANFGEANLSVANLDGANLDGANLSIVDLWSADLSRANLSKAYLRNAKVTDKQLAQAKSLKGATMPDGSVHP